MSPMDFGPDRPLSLDALELPAALRRHLQAVTGPDPGSVRNAWEPDGTLEFPYAAHGRGARKLDGIDAIVEYFVGPAVFQNWTFHDARSARLTGDGEAASYVVELHGSATIVATGAAYEQDYVQILTVSARDRLATMREYWDPTRF